MSSSDIRLIPAAYKVYVIEDDLNKLTYVGAAVDEPSGVNIACAFYTIKERLDPETHLLVGVFETQQDTLVAFIGVPSEETL